MIHYRGKRAMREVGAAMGLSRDTVAALSSQIWGWGGGGDAARSGCARSGSTRATGGWR